MGEYREMGNTDDYGRCIFVSIYENRKMILVEIVLRRGEGRRIMMECINLTMI
jgi:uncharacterized protein YuzE